jgi:hypothetical protein
MSLRDEIAACVVDVLRRTADLPPGAERFTVRQESDGITEAVLALLAEKGKVMWSCEAHGVHPLLDDRCAYDPEGECGGGVRLLIPWEAADV